MKKSPFKPRGMIIAIVIAIASACMGYRFGRDLGAIAGFFIGAFASTRIIAMAFPYLLDERRFQTPVPFLVKQTSVVVLAIAIVFMLIRPKVMRGDFLGFFSDPVTPFAFVSTLWLAAWRLRQPYPYSEFPAGEKYGVMPSAALWLFLLFAFLWWWSDPVSSATSEIAAGFYDRALVKLDRRIVDLPKDEVALHNRGVAHLCKGNFDLAIADFSAAIDLHPDAKNSPLRLLRGIATELNGGDPESDYQAFRNADANGQKQIDKWRDKYRQLIAKQKDD